MNEKSTLLDIFSIFHFFRLMHFIFIILVQTTLYIATTLRNNVIIFQYKTTFPKSSFNVGTIKCRISCAFAVVNNTNTSMRKTNPVKLIQAEFASSVCFGNLTELLLFLYFFITNLSLDLCVHPVNNERVRTSHMRACFQYFAM